MVGGIVTGVVDPHEFDGKTPDDEKLKRQLTRAKILKNGLVFDEADYEFKEDFVPANISNPLEIHTTQELLERLKKNPKDQVEARIISYTKDGPALKLMDRKTFLEANSQRDSKKLREAARKCRENWDDFSWGGGGDQGTVGHDFTPLLGGPFNKQLYYRDYLRMISACFYAYHHDPVARAIVGIMVDFTMGRGFTLHTDNKVAQALWNSFVEVNDFHRQFDNCAAETSIYGENMWWWLPHNNARISFNPVAGEKIPKAFIPRIRMIDPSNIAEIITVPEDPVEGVLAYVWMAPTQYQMYTKDNQPSNKFIYTQIPANQMIHEKINAASNEKRGRSDYFPALGYMKRLRDGVNYSLVAQQKAAAWSVDTTIEGNEQDLNDYIASQTNAIQDAGSEFVHTKAIERKYLSNTAAAHADSPIFNWSLNMICMATGIPMSYLGTHLSGGSNRASALVSTEPVAKRFERRRLFYDRIIQRVFKDLMGKFGIEADCEIVFPELITQDRSAKFRDLMLAQNSGWISPKRAAEMAAKELDIKDFDYETEMTDIMDDDKRLGLTLGQQAPLTQPGLAGEGATKSSALTSPEKTKTKKQLGAL